MLFRFSYLQRMYSPSFEAQLFNGLSTQWCESVPIYNWENASEALNIYIIAHCCLFPLISNKTSSFFFYIQLYILLTFNFWIPKIAAVNIVNTNQYLPWNGWGNNVITCGWNERRNRSRNEKSTNCATVTLFAHQHCATNQNVCIFANKDNQSSAVGCLLSSDGFFVSCPSPRRAFSIFSMNRKHFSIILSHGKRRAHKQAKKLCTVTTKGVGAGVYTSLDMCVDVVNVLMCLDNQWLRKWRLKHKYIHHDINKNGFWWKVDGSFCVHLLTYQNYTKEKGNAPSFYTPETENTKNQEHL